MSKWAFRNICSFFLVASFPDFSPIHYTSILKILLTYLLPFVPRRVTAKVTGCCWMQLHPQQSEILHTFRTEFRVTASPFSTLKLPALNRHHLAGSRPGEVCFSQPSLRCLTSRRQWRCLFWLLLMCGITEALWSCLGARSSSVKLFRAIMVVASVRKNMFLFTTFFLILS